MSYWCKRAVYAIYWSSCELFPYFYLYWSIDGVVCLWRHLLSLFANSAFATVQKMAFNHFNLVKHTADPKTTITACTLLKEGHFSCWPLSLLNLASLSFTISLRRGDTWLQQQMLMSCKIAGWNKIILEMKLCYTFYDEAKAFYLQLLSKTRRHKRIHSKPPLYRFWL